MDEIPCKSCLKFPVCIKKEPFEFCEELRTVTNDIYYRMKRLLMVEVRRDLTATELSVLYHQAWTKLYIMYPKLRKAVR